MYKKLLLAVFLCLCTLSLVMMAQEKALVLELLASVQGGIFNETSLQVPNRINFESTGPLFTFHVKPSSKTETIIFDFGCQSEVVWWLGYTPQNYWSGFHLNLTSVVIPDDMRVDLRIALA